MKFFAALLLVIAFSGLSLARKEEKSVKGEWQSRDKSIYLMYYDDETWEEYDYNGDKTNKYKTVGESISGYPIITPLKYQTNKIFKAIGSKSILVMKKTFEYIESDGKVEIKGSWIKDPRCKSNLKCKTDPCSFQKSCEGFKKATCVPDYCKSCKSTKWFDKEVLVECKRKESQSEQRKDSSRSDSRSSSKSEKKSEQKEEKCESQEKQFDKQLDLLEEQLERKAQNSFKNEYLKAIVGLEKDLKNEIKLESQLFKTVIEKFPQQFKKRIEKLLKFALDNLHRFENEIKKLPEVREQIKEFEENFEEDIRLLITLINIEKKFFYGVISYGK